MRSAALFDRLRNSPKLGRWRGEYGAPCVLEILVARVAGSQLLGRLTAVAYIEFVYFCSLMP